MLYFCMHTKVLGGLGVCKTAEFFIKLSIPVFVELFCDNSEVDLVVQYDKLYTIQVKTRKSRNDVVILELDRSSNKQRLYSHVDIFCAYVHNIDLLLWIDSSALCGATYVNFYLGERTKNNQRKNVRFANDYLLPSFLSAGTISSRLAA